MVKQKDIDRFNKKIIKDQHCWSYLGYHDSDGYGRFWYNGTTIGAHQFSVLMSGQVIPKGYVVCHTCDNPGCVNPSHLFIGTVADNNADRDNKGRHTSTPGEKNGASRFKTQDILYIRQHYIKGHNTKELAEKFNCHPNVILNIVKRKTWKHI